VTETIELTREQIDAGFLLDDGGRIQYQVTYKANGQTRVFATDELTQEEFRKWRKVGGTAQLWTGLGGPVPGVTPTTSSTARIQDLPWIFDRPKVPVTYLVDGLLEAGVVTQVTGIWGSGKSSFLNAMAYHVAKGKPFMGLETLKRPVLILDRENPEPTIQERFERMHLTEKPDDFVYWGIYYSAVPEFGEPPRCDDNRVINYVKECEVKPLIIVDSFISYHRGESENDADKVRAHLQIYRNLTALGATVIVIHHAGKSAENWSRGSSDIPAAVDAAYLFKNHNHKGGLELDEITLEPKRQRGLLTLRNIKYEDGVFRLMDRPTGKTKNEQFRQILLNNPWISKDDFVDKAKDAGLGRDPARKFLDDGVKKKRIVEEKRRNEETKREYQAYTWQRGFDDAEWGEPNEAEVPF
jgi:hypothetical protein